MQIARLPLQIASVPFANCNRALFFVKALTPFSPRITHPRVAKGWQGLPRVGSGCQGLAELPRSAEGCQGLPRVAGAAKSWQGFPRAVSDFPHHDGHTYQPLASLRLSAAVRKRKERNSLEAEARRIANVDFCLEVRVKKVRVNKFSLITNSFIRPNDGGARFRGPPPRRCLLTQSIPFGHRAPSTMLESHLSTFCTFVLLPFANSIIFAKRGKNTNGYKRSTTTQRKQHLGRPERVQTEYKRVQT